MKLLCLKSSTTRLQLHFLCFIGEECVRQLAVHISHAASGVRNCNEACLLLYEICVRKIWNSVHEAWCLLTIFIFARLITALPFWKPTFRVRTKGKGEGNVYPRTTHEDPEGEQMYSSTLPSTWALDVGGWSTPRPGCFTPRKDPVPIVQEAGWAPGPVWTGAQNLAPHRYSIPGPSSPYRVAIPTELSRPPCPY